MQRGLLGGIFQRGGGGRRSKDKPKQISEHKRIECNTEPLQSSDDRLAGVEFKSIKEIKQNLFMKPEKRTKSHLPAQIRISPLKQRGNFNTVSHTDSPTPSTATMCTSASNKSESSNTFSLMSDISMVSLEREVFSSIAASSKSSQRSWHPEDPAIARGEWLAERSVAVEEVHMIEWEIQYPEEMISGWYQGPLLNNEIPHGRGIFSLANGDKYEGSFDMGSMHGLNAVFTEADGSIYRGEFQNNLRHGRGKYLTPCRRYVGEFEYGKPHGEGTQFYLDGSVDFEGSWVFGEPSVEVAIDDCEMRDILEELSDGTSLNNIVMALANQKETLEAEKLQVQEIVIAMAEKKRLWEAELEEKFQAENLQKPAILLHTERLEL
mmetsp:Transcript_29981/g.49500  ORF Transcript_29981/g.49500 Transcript_29981/m.49500 type:complete len:379 (+) Transcript_29981:44-1180(+)|eukprot:CAMPEP_0119013470 /NCGR_PEP_ID=MMETSP1176-20130426/8466_1 /TAXON_ID=265551 /ORGANISM="Synedropsis recta cf, Strain CCMP1620" /LENGTH=378 /DNA_ID=CAMNT_0006966563 /DNA_START=25 /DNA_END=1164 /DNA_ORIENTATION=-